MSQQFRGAREDVRSQVAADPRREQRREYPDRGAPDDQRNRPEGIRDEAAGYQAALLYGLVAPAGTPKPIVDRLNKELRAALATEAVRKRLATEGADALPSSPADYAADIDREEIAWSKLLKSIGLHAKK